MGTGNCPYLLDAGPEGPDLEANKQTEKLCFDGFDAGLGPIYAGRIVKFSGKLAQKYWLLILFGSRRAIRIQKVI